MSSCAAPLSWRSCLVLGAALGLTAGCSGARQAAAAAPQAAARAERVRAGDVPAGEGPAVPPSPSSGCGRPSPGAGELVARAGELETPYLLTLPDGYDGSKPVPLVFAFHGRARSHQLLHDVDGSYLPEQLGSRYAVAYVKSLGQGFDRPRERSDNLQVFDALYAHLLSNYCIDSEQVFAIGHSSGALFSEILACERAPLLRGIGAVAGALVLPECPGRSAALMVHGERDAVVSVSRGRYALDRFLHANGCSQQSTPVGPAGCVRYAGCEPSLPVEWCEHGEPTYENTNHGWPSFASAEIARFLGTLGRVPHAAGAPLIVNGAFDGGSEPWQVSFAGSARGTWSLKNGALCATLESESQNAWDAQMQQAGLKLVRGSEVVIDFRLWTSPASDVKVKLGLDAPPSSEYWVKQIAATPEPRRVIDRFVLADPAPGTLALGFQFSGPYARKLPVTVCIDEVSVTQGR